MNRRTFVQLGLAGAALTLARRAWALKFYPKTSPKKWAILYATWCGSSRDAAVWISEGMAGIADVFDVREKPDLKDYDHIVLGSSIRSFKIHPLLEQYITDNKDWLKDKVRGLWALCNNMGQAMRRDQCAGEGLPRPDHQGPHGSRRPGHHALHAGQRQSQTRGLFSVRQGNPGERERLMTAVSQARRLLPPR